MFCPRASVCQMTKTLSKKASNPVAKKTPAKTAKRKERDEELKKMFEVNNAPTCSHLMSVKQMTSAQNNELSRFLSEADGFVMSMTAEDALGEQDMEEKIKGLMQSHLIKPAFRDQLQTCLDTVEASRRQIARMCAVVQDTIDMGEKVDNAYWDYVEYLDQLSDDLEEESGAGIE